MFPWHPSVPVRVPAPTRTRTRTRMGASPALPAGLGPPCRGSHSPGGGGQAQCILGQPWTPARCPHRPVAAAKTTLVGVGRSRDPRRSAHFPHGLLQLHPSRVLGVLVRLSFFEETDSIFYREQAAFLIFVSFFRCDFYLGSDPLRRFGGEVGSLIPVTPSGRAARPGHMLGREPGCPARPAARPGPQRPPARARALGREAGPAGPWLCSHGDRRWTLSWAEAPGTPRGAPQRGSRVASTARRRGPERPQAGPWVSPRVPRVSACLLASRGDCPRVGGGCRGRGLGAPAGVVLESLLRRREMKTHHVIGCGAPPPPTEGRGVLGYGVGSPSCTAAGGGQSADLCRPRARSRRGPVASLNVNLGDV